VFIYLFISEMQTLFDLLPVKVIAPISKCDWCL